MQTLFASYRDHVAIFFYSGLCQVPSWLVDSTTFYFHNAYIFVKLTHDNTQGNYKEDKNFPIKDNHSMIFASITIPIIMSEQSEPSTRPTRAKKKKCEDKIIRDILKLQGDLITEHNTACLFTFSSKHGQLQFGSTNAVDKFKADFANDEEWQTPLMMTMTI